jgi:hypothetical protein
MARLEDRCLGRWHNAIRARVQREGTQTVLGIEIDRPIWGKDERPDVKPGFDPNRSPDNEGHIVRGRQLDERSQTRIALGKGQIIGEIQLVTGQRQLRKDEHPDLSLPRGADESKVGFEIGFEITPPWDCLGGSQRSSSCHSEVLITAFT